jgi:hypothetical protein
MFGVFLAALLHFLGCPAPFIGLPLIWCSRLGCRLNHCFAVDPPAEFLHRWFRFLLASEGWEFRLSLPGGTTTTKKSSKPKKAKTQDKLSSLDACYNFPKSYLANEMTDSNKTSRTFGEDNITFMCEMGNRCECEEIVNVFSWSMHSFFQARTQRCSMFLCADDVIWTPYSSCPLSCL